MFDKSCFLHGLYPAKSALQTYMHIESLRRIVLITTTPILLTDQSQESDMGNPVKFANTNGFCVFEFKLFDTRF